MVKNPKELPVFERLRELVGKNSVHIFMKGTPQFPQCGFSARTAEILKRCVPTFSHTNILLDVDVYKNLPSFSNWPTFPQVFVNGELVGGCDIVTALYQSGELERIVHTAVAATSESE